MANVLWFSSVFVLAHRDHWPQRHTASAMICFAAVTTAGAALLVRVVGHKIQPQGIDREFADAWILENGASSPAQQGHRLPLIITANERFAASV
jgi:hypothetical protein